jgi:hypothetical protein
MDTSAIGVRPLGGIIGAVAPGTVAAVSAWLDSPVTVIAAFGIPVGAVLGYAMAPPVIAAASPWRPAFLSAAAAVLIAIASLQTWSLVASGSSVPTVVVWLPVVTFFAFVVGMPVAFPVALVSAVLLRRIAGRWPVDDTRSEARAPGGAAERRP